MIPEGQGSKCSGCEKARDDENSISLEGGWSVNHYGGDEGYLGWLALQPQRHVMALTELRIEEQQHLGPHIVNINRALDDYWTSNFRDPVKKVYINYFFEEPEGDWHLHMRLIPRFQSMNDDRLKAWNVWMATTRATFRARYRRDSDLYESDVANLMRYLRSALKPMST